MKYRRAWYSCADGEEREREREFVQKDVYVCARHLRFCIGELFTGIKDKLVDSADVSGHIKLAFAAIVVHETDLPENIALGPAHVMHAADAPHAAHIPIWVAAIERVPVYIAAYRGNTHTHTQTHIYV